MRAPVVSVIMSVYNGERFLAEAIESILAQSLGDFEFLIVDDCSTDNTAQVVHSFKDPRIQYFKMPCNAGCSAARNLGMRVARGRYIVCMDADDVSLQDRLERQARFLDTHASVGLVACGYVIADEAWVPLFRNDWGDDVAPINDLIAHKPHFIGPTMCFRRDCLEKVGMYRPGLDMMEDYDLSLRIGEHYKVGILGGISYKYRLHGMSACATKAAQMVRGVILVRQLAEERRLTGTDRLSALSESQVRHYVREYFSVYDQHSSGNIPLYYFMLSRRFFCDGAWKAAAKYLMKGVMENPFRKDTFKLVFQVLKDRRQFNKLGPPINSNQDRVDLPVST